MNTVFPSILYVKVHVPPIQYILPKYRDTPTIANAINQKIILRIFI